MAESDPQVALKYWSQYLNKEQVHEALLSLHVVLLNLLGQHKLIANYGFSVNLHNDLTWVPMRTDTELLQYFIEDSLEPKIIVPGESDLHLEVPEKRMNIHFCHESDIHLTGTDEDLLQKFMQSEPFSRMNWKIEEPRKLTPS